VGVCGCVWGCVGLEKTNKNKKDLVSVCVCKWEFETLCETLCESFAFV
jgi:hypothetical protein